MKILLDYLFWHYAEAPLKILKIWRNFLIFFYHFFSVDLLLVTLFHPWKREYLVKNRPGFSFEEWATRFTFNLFSKIVGACVRLTAIFIWLITEWLFILSIILLLPLWLLTPFLSFPLYYSNLPQVKQRKKQQALDDFLNKRALAKEDIPPVTAWFERVWRKKQKQARFWTLANLLKIPGLAHDWAYGFTPNLDKFSQDLTKPRPYSHHLVGRKKEVDQIEQVLSRASQNNVLLVGDPGVGKETIILGFAKRVKEGTIFPILKRKRVLELKMGAILAKADGQAKAQDLLTKLLNEASSAGNIILVIFDLDKYIAASKERVDLTHSLAPCLTGSQIQLIGTTTPELFQKYIFKNEEILKVFEKIEVSQPSEQEALIILEEILPQFEKRAKAVVTYQALEKIIERSEQLVSHIPFPEKAIDLLDEVIVFCQQKKEKIVLPEHVDLLVSQKTRVPTGALSQEEKEKLTKLEELIHQKVIDQEGAVSSLAQAMRRARAEISEKARPIGSFLFLGPTGVGKTQTAKALAWAWFGKEENMVRIDFSEFQTKEDLARLIGNFKSGAPGVLASKIRENPFAVLLLDELEKAHPKILNLFLQILDEGFFTDAFGKRVSCQNLIIIGTSNAGSEFIRKKFTLTLRKNHKKTHDRGRFWDEELPKMLVEEILKRKIFSPELINRFDGVIVFKPLTKENLEDIARLLLNELNDRLLKKKIQLKITPELLKRVAELGWDPAFGARPMKRVIQNKIESPIAQMLLEGNLKSGEAIDLDPTALLRA